MRESVSAACIKSYDKAEKGTLSPLECLSFANTKQADLPTCATNGEIIFVVINTWVGNLYVLHMYRDVF